MIHKIQPYYSLLRVVHGMPKGVILTHHNILSMTAGTVAMNHFTQQEVTLNWMPLDHVGAIVFSGTMAVDLGLSSNSCSHGISPTPTSPMVRPHSGSSQSQRFSVP
jgi:long-subunit acyl-CoA synthetase (AMP-forming)